MLRTITGKTWNLRGSPVCKTLPTLCTCWLHASSRPHWPHTLQGPQQSDVLAGQGLTLTDISAVCPQQEQVPKLESEEYLVGDGMEEEEGEEEEQTDA